MKKSVFVSIVLCGLLLVCSACGSSKSSSSSAITLQEVKTAIEDKTLNWDTFKNHKHKDIGSGLYVWEYEMEGGQKLQIGGPDLKASPTQVHLIDSEGKSKDLLK